MDKELSLIDRFDGILGMVKRRISFMKESEVQDEIDRKGKMEFIQLWAPPKVKVTIEVLDEEEDQCIKESAECLEESRACEHSC